HRAWFERHAADGTGTRLVTDDLGVHRTGPLRARGRRGADGLERHAALRAAARPDLSDLGVHRARVLAGVRTGAVGRHGFPTFCSRDVCLRRAREPLVAPVAAEGVRRAAVLLVTDRVVRADAHAADRVDNVVVVV